MADAHEIKYKEMQKYIPFIQRVIEKLKVNNEHQIDNPRKAQLQKMEMLNELLTNKHKKIKMETLLKCEGVLIKLRAKIEKNDSEDSILSGVKLRPQTPCKPDKNTLVQETVDLSGPASPPPETTLDDVDQPVVIPTERRCSPVLDKEKERSSADKPQQDKKETQDIRHSLQQQDSQHSTNKDFESIRRKVFTFDGNANRRHQPIPDKRSSSHQQRPHKQSRTSVQKEHHHAKDTQHSNQVNNSNRQSSSILPKGKTAELVNTPPASGKKLQTVKVVITEPLPANFKKQHFPHSNLYSPRPSSVCHSNLRTLARERQKITDDFNEAYSSEETWQKYNEHNSRPISRPASTAPVFSRLGAKVSEDCSASSSAAKPTGRYTPIPDVLKSPPLSVSDINNLLLESGAGKIVNDISDIGSRRPAKNVDNQRESANNSLEFIRKKLAQTTRMSSKYCETSKAQTDHETRSSISLSPHERIALKYNPHPRQERLQSVSSTDGSECSTQSRVNDPRIKSKLQTGNSLHSSPPTQIPASNVNVLPTINLSDPRLKKQIAVTPPSERKCLPLNSPSNADFLNQNRQKIRIAHIPNNTSPIRTTPPRRLSTNQRQYSSEENWDTDEEEKARPPPAIKTDPRLAITGQYKYENYTDIRNLPLPPTARNNTRFSSDSNADIFAEASVSKPYPQSNANAAKCIQHKETNFNKLKVPTDAATNSTKPKKKTEKTTPLTTFVVPNPPKSDSEEDWDAEDNTTTSATTVTTTTTTTVKPKTVSADVPQPPITKSPLAPVIAPYHHPVTQISPKVFVSPVHISPAATSPVYVPPILQTQAPYPMMGLKNQHPNALMQNSTSNNRFNSILNDKTEREKYLESKKQKTIEARTYKEFREAKEKARSEEAAIKRSAGEAEAKKRAQELKDACKDKEIRENAFAKKEQQMNASKKAAEEEKRDKKIHNKDNNKKPPLAVESTLDKMYRTQNFNSNFPKANTSFKIPKKKTEEATKEEEAVKTMAALPEQSGIKLNEKPVDTVKSSEATVPLSDKTKSLSREQDNKKITDDIKVSQTKHIVSVPPKRTDTQSFDNSSTKTTPVDTEKSINDKAKEKVSIKKISETISPETLPPSSINEIKVESKEKRKEESKEKVSIKKISETISPETLPPSSIKEIKVESQEKRKEESKEKGAAEPVSENNANKSAEEDNKMNVRDPRCRPKPATTVIKDVTDTTTKERETPHEETQFKMLGDIVITSAENQVVLKPQQNLEKFNKLTQELAPKAQRILRRRNTMVVFDSAPLVDKEKLKKANALLVEDLQEEVKRKCEQEEEDRLMTRRNKILEEMFKKTDDNCTVSTQNIITGKRRTRPTINFNEIKNTRNIFKHLTVKDSPLSNLSSIPSTAPAVKAIKSNFKIKLKNLPLSSLTKEEEESSDEDENLQSLAKKVREQKAISKTENKVTKIKVENKVEESSISETKTNAKLAKKRPSANRKSSNTTSNAGEAEQSEFKFRPIQNDENQNCAVSSTSTDNYAVQDATPSSTSATNINTAATKILSKHETDDNEPTSTASKSNNPTPTPEQHVLNEIVDQILKPSADRERILGLLGQILNEEKLELVKSIIESNNRHNEEQQITEEATDTKRVGKMKTSTKNKGQAINEDEDCEAEEEVGEVGEEEQEDQDRQSLKSTKGTDGKRLMPKKKRSELDRLNEDIRDMFICEGVLTATGRRMCTIMGKDVDSTGRKKLSKESAPSPLSEQEHTNTSKELLKPPVVTRFLRRSLRGCKTFEDNDDDEAQSTTSRTTEESFDDFNATDNSTTTDTTPQRKMPVLKPHTPIKILEEVPSKPKNIKEAGGNKRKSDSNFGGKAKKGRFNKDEDSESEEKESEAEAEGEAEDGSNKKTIIKNNNVHWHNQSKYTTWCMICEKRMPANLSSLHYKSHHRENYISRMAPVLLQQYKQGKRNQPLFGVKKAQKQPSWFYRCPFCLKYFNTAMPLWLEHFQNHTVELRFECSKCHRCSNRKKTVSRHLKSCEGATIITSAIKLNTPTVITAHVCHLCNFIQLKRVNLERHYIEQHQLDQKRLELLGYVIKLFDAENVECVAEEHAVEREKQAWKSIEEDEQVIDIDDDDGDDDEEKERETPVNAAENAENVKKKKTETKSTEIETKKTAKGKKRALDERNQKIISGNALQRTEEEIAYKKTDTGIVSNSQQAKKCDIISNFSNQQRQAKENTQKQANINTATADKHTMQSLQSSSQQQVHTAEDQAGKTEPKLDKTTRFENDKKESPRQEVTATKEDTHDEKEKSTCIKSKIFATKTYSNKRKQQKVEEVTPLDLSEGNESNDIVIIEENKSAKYLQDELLVLAAAAAEQEEQNQISNEKKCENETTSHERTTSDQPQTTMSDIISESIDIIYNRDNKRNSIELESSEANKRVCLSASNAFMPTREENNYSPTIQILAQSIINIEEQGHESVREKPITMAERLSQRFKGLQNDKNISSEKSNSDESPSNSFNTNSKGNVFENLINDTLLELKIVKDNVATNVPPSDVLPSLTMPKENVFEKLFSETVLELEKDNEMQQAENVNATNGGVATTDAITVISDDEDWEDIEITETAPAVSTSGVNAQKSKSKGLFQKFGIFKGNNTKTKKHLPPLVYLPKKKKEKPLQPQPQPQPPPPQSQSQPQSQLQPQPQSPTTTLSSIIAPIITTKAVATTRANEFTTNTIANTNNSLNICNIAHLGFKPVVNIMDGLFPDSPCNDPIDLVPELAPLEPLQDLNDISSILDSNLSAVNINAADNHTSIEDALDFISEQQENDKEISNSLTTLKSKTTINNISHVGFSVQNAEDENAFKFYCLLQNCSFLYSSDSVGLENHFMCEHSEIKWNGYCLMCQSQCFPNVDASEEHSISKEIRHMLEKHANKPALDLNTDSTQHSSTSSHDNEDRPKIKLRRLTGDCLSRATPENVISSSEIVSATGIVATATAAAAAAAPAIATATPIPSTSTTTSISMLGALLAAEPKPPTKEMPPQIQMPLTEPLLLADGMEASPELPFRNVNRDFLITSVTSSAAQQSKLAPLQISSVVSLNKTPLAPPAPTTPITPSSATDVGQQIQMPKILNVRTLASKSGGAWSQQIEKDRQELLEAAEESQEVSRILENARRSSANRDVSRSVNDSPVLVAETMPLAQSKTGDFVVTQTVSAQYSEFSSTALGFNISIAATTPAVDAINAESLSSATLSSASISSRQYKCMGSGCKFVSRVPVAMSDHLRFHERRNFSNKQDYLSCGFCFYCATDIEDYMKHANQFHIIGKGSISANGTAATVIGTGSAASSETDTAASLTKKIQNILNSSNGGSGLSRYSAQNYQRNTKAQVQDTQEVYLKKLRQTIDEIVGPTGLADDKLYRCVIKNCYSQLTESNFLTHIMFHIATNGGNPNNYIFKCPHCTAQYHRPAGIKAHIKNHARNRYFCYLCDETSTNPGQLLKHFSDNHWHTLNMYTKELLKPKIANDGSEAVFDSSYYVAYTQDLSAEEVRKFGEKLILDWQRKKCGSKTHFKSSEIDLLPLSPIFQREVNCGECEYKTKVRTNIIRHLLMHRQNPGMGNKSGVSNVCSVDPINPVPCLNSNERFFDKMTNLASSSLIPSNSSGSGSGTGSGSGSGPSQTTTTTTNPAFKIPYAFVEENKRYTCGCPDCNYCYISEDLFRAHLTYVHRTAMTYSCKFCQEEICKRGITVDRIINHTRFHAATIFRCEECNYVHHLRYVVERHANEKHATMKLNIITHNRSSDNSVEGTATAMPFTGKKYKETVEGSQMTAQSSNTSCTTRSATNSSESSGIKPPIPTFVSSTKGKGKWICDVCGQRASTVSQIQTHCQQQHGVRNQYKCVHCNFGSQQLSQILHHIDEKHSGMTREARYMYHKMVNSGDEVCDTRPLWQRNDPTRVRHIRGILMEDEEESEEYRKKLALTEDVDDESNEDKDGDLEENEEELSVTNYITGYEFGCYHCSFKTQTFEDLRNQHYVQTHNSELETAKPFWYRLHRRLCCPECRSFLGNYNELHLHLQNTHRKSRFYAADIRMAEYDDTSHRILCGYCSFHCANAEHLLRHHLRVQHWPQDIRIDNNEQINEILALGNAELSYQCTLCTDIFSNRVAIVQHACNFHAGEDNFSFRELRNSPIYRCNSCSFTSTIEKDLLRHSIDHYSRFKVCHFCRAPQSSFNVNMQHCYAEHKNDIQKFKTLFPLREIRRFLLQTLIIFPSGLVLNRRNLLNTQYGKTEIIEEIYEDIYKVSQQPPIPRLSIARLVARKSIEAQQKHQEEEIFDTGAQLARPRCISSSAKRRLTVDHDQQHQQQGQRQQHQQNNNEFNVPMQLNSISKRRRTVAVDREMLFSSNLMSSSNTSITDKTITSGKKRKISIIQTQTFPSKDVEEFESYPLNLDKEPFSFYGQTPEEFDLTKIYTKVTIGGIKTPLTIDKFKLLFDIECQLKLTKCDDGQLAYKDYRHIQKACPASHKMRFDQIDKEGSEA